MYAYLKEFVVCRELQEKMVAKEMLDLQVGQVYKAHKEIKAPKAKE